MLRVSASLANSHLLTSTLKVKIQTEIHSMASHHVFSGLPCATAASWGAEIQTWDTQTSQLQEKKTNYKLLLSQRWRNHPTAELWGASSRLVLRFACLWIIIKNSTTEANKEAFHLFLTLAPAAKMPSCYDISIYSRDNSYTVALLTSPLQVLFRSHS